MNEPCKENPCSIRVKLEEINEEVQELDSSLDIVHDSVCEDISKLGTRLDDIERLIRNILGYLILIVFILGMLLAK